MNRKWISIGLVSVILLQLAVLGGEYLGAVYPLWTGKEVRLKVVPFDPRSLFRGNYARLNYDISRLNTSDLQEIKSPRNGEIVYVSLKPDDQGLYTFSEASIEKPESGMFIRGRVNRSRWWGGSGRVPIKYGIEAWFAPKKKALELERTFRRYGGVATIMVASNGKATLKSVEANSPPESSPAQPN